MRTRGAAALLSLTILCAACGAGGPEAGPGVVLRYSYQPGDTLSYDLDAALDLDMTAAGNSAAAAGMDASMAMSVTARLDLGLALGPTPDTIEITVAEELLEGGARMTSGGREVLIPLDELAAELEQDVVVVVDPQDGPSRPRSGASPCRPSSCPAPLPSAGRSPRSSSGPSSLRGA